MMLKAFGLTDVDIEKIRIFVPQVPTVAQGVVNGVNDAIKRMDARFKEQSDKQEAQSEAIRLLSKQQTELLEAFNESIRHRQLSGTNSPGNDTGADTIGSTSGNNSGGAGTGNGRRKR